MDARSFLPNAFANGQAGGCAISERTKRRYDGSLRSDVVFVLGNLGDNKTLPALVSLLVDVNDRQYRDPRNSNRDEFVSALRWVVEVSQDTSTVTCATRYIEGV